jgi:TPR repeat protein
MAQRESRDHLKGNVCTPGRFSSCLSRCSEGEAGACYWLGYELQQGHAESSVSELLYQRSCRLGIASGCTNRAAGQLADHPNDAKAQACAAQTFAKTCSLDDPWGCTMYGFHLSRGIGVAQDRQLALKVLNKSCRYGTDDPACSSGMRLKDELQGKSTEERPGQVRPKSQTGR